uniref:Iron-sulfur cluster assembly 1 homolog, mitochondrial n=1 Tax=Triatoma dimidiata TaxID=72491 RepID=A0A0V0G796_TRIDM
MANVSGIAVASIRAVKARNPIASRAALVLTPAAVKRVKELLEGKSNAIGLKVGVRQRGCNGLSYTLEYCTEKMKMDEEVLQDGVRIVIDRKAQLTLLGTEMDFIENKLTSEFVFNNPNITGTCGCGESFSV